jgi:hypothetical protein
MGKLLLNMMHNFFIWEMMVPWVCQAFENGLQHYGCLHMWWPLMGECMVT